MPQLRFSHHSTTAEIAAIPPGIAGIHVHGPVTDACLDWLGQTVFVRAGEIAEVGFLADCRGSMLAFNAQSLDALLAQTTLDDPIRLPAALLVRPDQAEFFRGHCIRMAFEGIPRRIFSARQPALSWLLAQPVTQRRRALASA